MPCTKMLKFFTADQVKLFGFVLYSITKKAQEALHEVVERIDKAWVAEMQALTTTATAGSQEDVLRTYITTANKAVTQDMVNTHRDKVMASVDKRLSRKTTGMAA